MPHLPTALFKLIYPDIPSLGNKLKYMRFNIRFLMVNQRGDASSRSNRVNKAIETESALAVRLPRSRIWRKSVGWNEKIGANYDKSPTQSRTKRQAAFYGRSQTNV